MKKSYILLSAYACEPDRGSEPGVGFNWMLALLERGLNLIVLTRSNNRDAIISRTARFVGSGQLVVVGIDIDALLGMKRRGVLPVMIYYICWQFLALSKARAIIRSGELDVSLVWHLTFGVCRFPTLLPLLPIRSLIGPLGGAETMPIRFLAHVGARGIVLESLRWIANQVSRINPLEVLVYRRAGSVLFKTRETARRYSALTRRCRIQFEIGTRANQAPAADVPRERLTYLFVGRLLYLKGIRFLCTAFAEAARRGLAANLHFIGDGPERRYIEAFRARSSFAAHVVVTASVPHAVARARIREADLLTFPTLRDSSGNVIIEAIEAGTPILALDLGGPGELLKKYSGLIPARRRSYNETVADFADHMIQFQQSSDFRRRLRCQVLELQEELSFEKAVSTLVQCDLDREGSESGSS
jgi:glycosyltransferase involved in cell wall biosynthesis